MKVQSWYAVQVSDTTMLVKAAVLAGHKTVFILICESVANVMAGNTNTDNVCTIPTQKILNPISYILHLHYLRHKF